MIDSKTTWTRAFWSNLCISSSELAARKMATKRNAIFKLMTWTRNIKFERYNSLKMYVVDNANLCCTVSFLCNQLLFMCHLVNWKWSEPIPKIDLISSRKEKFISCFVRLVCYHIFIKWGKTCVWNDISMNKWKKCKF